MDTRTVCLIYTNQSASTVAQDLLQRFAPGFTWRHVDPELPIIDVISFTNVDLTDALTQLAKRIGGYWRVDYFGDLWFGLTESDGAQPVPLTVDHPSLDAFTSTSDISQIITRALREGGGVNAAGPCDVGQTSLPVEDAITWYNPAGGRVACGSQRITYTGVITGGAGSLVGPGAAPSTAPNLALAAGTGLGTGWYGYGVVDVTAAGKSLPSPIGTIMTDTPLAAPSSAPIYYDAATPGNLQDNYNWACTFVNTNGETTAGPRMFNGSSATFSQVLTIPTGPAGTIARKIYRTAGQPTMGDAATAQLKFLGTVPDNSTVLYSDNAADGALGANVPTVNTTGGFQVVVTAIAIGAALTAQLQLLHTFADNTTTGPYTDSAADGSLGANAPTSDTSGLTQPSGQVLEGSVALLVAGAAPFSASGGLVVIGNGQQVIRYTGIGSQEAPTVAPTATLQAGAGLDPGVHGYAYTWVTAAGESLPSPVFYLTTGGSNNQAVITAVAVGPTGTIARNFYKTTSNGAQLIYASTIADNTTTAIGTDTQPDSAFSGHANAPTLDTSGLDARSFLIGIPATGTGAITATISYNSTITAASALTGIPASGAGSILYPILKGDPVNLLVQVDDAAAQAALSALLDPSNLLNGAAGIREDYVQDGTIGETEARARGDAQLALVSRALVSTTYTCRDPLTASGRDIVIDLPSPTSISATLKIQQVTISNFRAAEGFFPDYAVQASTVRQSFEDLLMHFRKQLNG